MRSVAAVLGAVLTLTMISSGADAVEPPAPPVINFAGQVNARTISFVATSAAPYVLFRLSNSSYGPYVTTTPVAADEDGKFRDEISSRGLNRQSYATAVNCESAAVESCSSQASDWHLAGRTGTVQLSTTDNPKQAVDPVVADAHIVVPDVGDDHPWLTVIGGPVTRRLAQVESGEHTVDVSDLPDGDYRLWLTRCSALNPQVCDEPVWVAGVWEASGRPVLAVRRTMYPQLQVLNEGYVAYVNPNRDGFADRARFRLAPDHAVAATSGSWRLVDGTGKTRIWPRALTSAALAGDEPIVVDPISAGLRLADGSYRIRVVVTGTVSGATKVATLEREIRVRNSHSLVGVRTTRSTFYPVRDHYRDTIMIDPSFNLGYAASTDVLRADGTVVRRHRSTHGSWGGRSESGRLLAEGRYRIRVRMESPNGERKDFYTPLFNLSHKRFVTKTFRKTVTAKASLIAERSGRCGPGLRAERTGAIRYLSGWCSGSRPENSAIGVHQLRLPRGRPISLKVGASGHSLERTNQAVMLGLERPSGRRMIWTDLSGRGAWFMHLEIGQFYPKDRKLRWELETAFGNRFRIRTFTVVFRYEVLSDS